MRKHVNLVDLVKTQEFSNEYFLAKFGFDTAENEPCQVCPTPRNAAAIRAGRDGRPQALGPGPRHPGGEGARAVEAAPRA